MCVVAPSTEVPCRSSSRTAVVLAGELDGSAVDASGFLVDPPPLDDDTGNARIKSWLYLNRDDDDETKRKVVEARVPFKSIPIDGTSLKDAERLKTTLSTYMKEEFERPGVIQCSTATRAGIPYILHLAETLNLTFETAMNVAKDMELNVVTRENLAQFLKRSIKEKGGGGGKRSGGRKQNATTSSSAVAASSNASASTHMDLQEADARSARVFAHRSSFWPSWREIWCYL